MSKRKQDLLARTPVKQLERVYTVHDEKQQAE